MYVELMAFPLFAGFESQIISPPNAQDVILNRNATFTCITEISTHIKWVINGSQSEAIYPSDIDGSSAVPPLLRDRGFRSNILISPQERNITYRLIVNGTLANNGTEIDCQLKNGHVPTLPVHLTVHGNE